MKAKDLNKKTDADLVKLVGDGRAKLQQFRFDLSSGKIKNVREIRKVRREIARLLTLLSQRKQ
jgi:large subunit ribosomal protein L29